MSISGAAHWPTTSRDVCLQVFLTCQALWKMPWADGSHIYEIGCAEADWLSLAQAAVPGATLTGVDCRQATRPGRVLQTSFENADIPDESQDWVVLISALEHMGLGHYKDPVFDDGDVRCLTHVRRVLKPGGSLYFDIPYTDVPGGGWLDGTSMRVYDIERLNDLREGWIERAVLHSPELPSEKKWVYRAHWWTKGEETTP